MKSKKLDRRKEHFEHFKANETQILGSLLGRSKYFASLGMSYGTNNNDRDIYQACGYRDSLDFENYYNYYKRFSVAKTVINKIPDKIWKSNPMIVVPDTKDTETGLEKEWRTLTKELKVFNKFNRLDKLLGLGNFAIMYFGFNDTLSPEEPVQKGPGLQLQYIQPYSCNSVDIVKFDQDMTSPRYGLPTEYKITIGGKTNYTSDYREHMSQTFNVHWTRVLHVAENQLETDIFGTPRLEACYNHLYDLEKITAGCGEMFWRGARPGYAAKAEKDARFNPNDTTLQDQLDEYEHNLRRWLTLQGIDVQSLAPQVVSPKDHIDAMLRMISIDTGIPKRMFEGSERGELASSTDLETFNNLIEDRMVNFVEPCMLEPFADWMIELGILPDSTAPEGKYTFEWNADLDIMGDKERADVNKTKIQTVAEYVKAPGADMVIPEDVFLSKIMEFSPEEIEEIKGYQDEMEVELEEAAKKFSEEQAKQQNQLPQEDIELDNV